MNEIIVTILERLKLKLPFRNEKSGYILMHDKDSGEVSAVPVDAVLAKVNDRVNALVYPDGFTKTTPINRVGNTVSIAPYDFAWRIDLNPYSNAAAFEKVLDPTSSSELKRVDTLAATKEGTIVYYPGVEDEFIIRPPDIRTDELRITDLTIFGDEIQEHTEPIVTEIFTLEEKEKLALLDATSDIDKPVSTAQAAADAAVLEAAKNYTDSMGSGSSFSKSNIDRWLAKLKLKTSGLKLAFVGDSTSDLEGNAFSITEFVEKCTKPGFALEGFDIANMPNYGSNGQSITGFIGDAGSKGLAALLADNLDLIIFSYGINDIRQNLLTKEELKANIIDVISQIKIAQPECDIVLRMPNSFNIPTTDVYIKQGGYSSLAEAAQKQSEILYEAYLELENKWSNVILFNTQDLIFGRISKPMTTALHSDEIHPRYDGIINVLVNDFIGYLPEFRKEEAIAVIDGSSTPWNQYGRVFEKEPEFIKFGEGILQEQGTGYTRIETKPNGSYDINGKFSYNDYISFNKGEIVVRATDIGIGNQARVDYGQTLPANTLENGCIVEFFKSRYNNTSLNQRYQEDLSNYPYRHKVKMGFCGSGFMRIDRFIDDDIITEKIKEANPSDIISINNAVLVLENASSETILTAATFGPVNGTQLQIGDVSGNFSSYSDTVAFIYSSSPLVMNSVIETGTSFALNNSHKDKIVILTSSCTVTLPNGLVRGFGVTIVTLTGVTLTLAVGGSVTLFNNEGLTMAEELSCTIQNRIAPNQYITAGNL